MTYYEAYMEIMDSVKTGLEGARTTQLKSEEWKEGAKFAYWEILNSMRGIWLHEIDTEEYLKYECEKPDENPD